jgi:glycosyltransferase involved in cell wall biosynthesis
MPRVAYFPDSYHEINGVAHTSRHFEAYARRQGRPFLCVRAGDRSQRFTAAASDSSVSTLELPRGFLSFALEKDLRYDPAFLRHLPPILGALRTFRPDLIHITGPSELGVAGALLANHLHLPLVASWHTNIHEYAATRSKWFLRMLPQTRRPGTAAAIERASFEASIRFYRLARLLYAPNPELCGLLERSTHRPCLLMQRGVDAELFSPARRTHPPDDRAPIPRGPVLGFVGRLSIEKNVQLLAEVHRTLPALGIADARFLIVGHGAEEAWLREHLPGAEFTGVLRGEALAQAYANMDCFVFPSHTDTFGNVVLEAMASGVPAVVTPDGGPAHLVTARKNGFIAADADFPAAIARLLSDPVQHQAMRQAARQRALEASWDAVFANVYEGYSQVLGHSLEKGA